MILKWEHSKQAGLVESEAVAFRDVVFAAAEKQCHTIRLHIGGSIPTVEHFPSWSDFFEVQVQCSDIGGMCPLRYIYHRADGLHAVASSSGHS